MNEELVGRLEAKAAEISGRVLDAMYENPFWSERFGERGKKHSRADGDYHFAYLVQALLAGDPAVVARYAEWLRSVLTSRGMCSRHLDENFERLGDVIGKEIAGGELAASYLGEARAALRYREGAAGEIEGALERGRAAIVDAFDRAASGASAMGADDPREHLSYLLDAIAAAEPRLFFARVQWTGEFLARRGVAAAPLIAALLQSAELVGDDAAVSTRARESAVAMLREGADRLARAPSSELESRPAS